MIDARCKKCAASLSSALPFCTNCGTKINESPQSTAAKHCVNCGAALEPGLRFCTHCGVASEAEPLQQPSQPWTATPAPAAVPSGSSNYIPPPPLTSTGAYQPVAPGQPIKKSGGMLFKLLVAVFIVFVVGGVAVAGGIAYLGYMAKKRVAAVKQAYNKDDFAGMIAAAKGKENPGSPDDKKPEGKGLLGGLMSAVTGNEDKPQPLPEWKAAPPELVASPPVRIPLRESLQINDVGTDRSLGDFESIYKIGTLNKDFILIKASQQFPAGQGFDGLFGNHNKKMAELNKIDCGRIVFMKDFADSAETDGYFCRQGRNERHPGTTAMGFSKKTFNELKTTGQAQLMFHDDPLHAVLKSFKNVITTSDTDKAAQDAAASDLMNKMMNFAPVGNGEAMETPAIPCTLRRDGPDLAFPVLVNDQPTQLPVMKVVCKATGSDREVQIYVLDDPDNPLFLAADSSTGGHTQVTKITWDQPVKSESGLAQQLKNDGRAKVYDLYFDFRSDVLRPESDKVLTEIAQVMKQHPDWTLGVEGNTDNIGGNAYNLDLSQRRSAAVKTALVKQYGIASGRLVTGGFGASNPVDTNDTIEGRARNRRVELVRK